MKTQIHRLDIREFDEINYHLIALNAVIEDYHLCFLLNSKLNIFLKREKLDLFSSGNSDTEGFSRYGFEDQNQDLYWSLVQNQKWVETTENNFSLFGNTQQKIYLLPEFKNVDYFLKIENSEFDDQEIQSILYKIKEINNVSAVFSVDASRLKSKNNLIF